MVNKDEDRAEELLLKIFENKEDKIESFIEVFGTKEFEEFMCIGIQKHLMKALVPFVSKIREETRKEIRKELDKILERLRGYGCGYHKQLERQILNLKKKFKEEKNNEDT